ncbi:hypothetical protein [Novosphingobium sp. BL-52-GroH]|uniref:hypothetical protein n=1 Tax=Novosphingobium sp. BL-52-GroH TaxID=3349877 RepID=UPI00384ADF2A
MLSSTIFALATLLPGAVHGEPDRAGGDTVTLPVEYLEIREEGGGFIIRPRGPAGQSAASSRARTMPVGSNVQIDAAVMPDHSPRSMKDPR